MTSAKLEILTSKSICTKTFPEFNINRIVCGIILLCIGGFMYLAFRPDSIVLFRLIDWLDLTYFISCIREFLSNIIIPEFIIYSIPDGLWISSYILIMTGIWTIPNSNQVLFCSFLPFIGFISEIGQYLGVVKGTPDYADLICYITPFLIYIVTRKIIQNKP